jgi:hypothetical protein
MTPPLGNVFEHGGNLMRFGWLYPQLKLERRLPNLMRKERDLG